MVRRGSLRVLRWRRVVNDNDLLGYTILVKFTPIRLLPSPILNGRNPCADSIVGGRHCWHGCHRSGRGGGRRKDFGGLSERKRGGCGGRRRRVEGVGIGGSHASRGSRRGSRMGRGGLVGRGMGIGVALRVRRMMRSRMRRSRRRRGRHDERRAIQPRRRILLSR